MYFTLHANVSPMTNVVHKGNLCALSSPEGRSLSLGIQPSVAQDVHPFPLLQGSLEREEDGIRLLISLDASHEASQPGRLAAAGSRGPVKLLLLRHHRLIVIQHPHLLYSLNVISCVTDIKAPNNND